MGNKGSRARKAQQQQAAGAAAADAGAAAGAAAGAEAADGEVPATMELDPALSQQGSRSLTVDDFELIKVLGRGSFGKVFLVKKKDGSDNLYAMKTLRKAQLIKRQQLMHTATERRILERLQCPFLLGLRFAFQTVDKLYIVLDFMQGGELFHWLKKHQRFSEQRAKLYAAEIILGLEALHSQNMIYRDLKPENILLDADGHLRIADFGLSKEGVMGAGAVGGTRTFCGTPEYLAPEILQNKGHGKAVDWWSLGTLLYEMLSGLPPFYDTNIQRMYDKILHARLTFGSHISNDAKSLLTGLLQRPVEARLGSGPGDAQELKDHPFFADLDWDRVARKDYTPEFIPPVSGDAAEHFDAEFTSEAAQDSLVVSNMTETQQEKSNFVGFTFDERATALAGADDEDD